MVPPCLRPSVPEKYIVVIKLDYTFWVTSLEEEVLVWAVTISLAKAVRHEVFTKTRSKKSSFQFSLPLIFTGL